MRATHSLALLLVAALALLACAVADEAAAPEAAAPPANANGTEQEAAPQQQAPVTVGMKDGFYPPEIESAQVAGLFVGFIFLLIFIPGFMCLYSIQTPQTFAMLDSTEMKKKLQ